VGVVGGTGDCNLIAAVASSRLIKICETDSCSKKMRDFCLKRQQWDAPKAQDLI